MMVVMIVLIVMIAGVIKARVRSGRDWRGQQLEESKDSLILRDEVRQLKERIATDPAERTAREIDALRDR